MSFIFLTGITVFASAALPNVKVVNPENSQEGQVSKLPLPVEATRDSSDVPTWYARPSVIAGWKSWNDSARLTEVQNPEQNSKARVFKSKNEVYLGVRAESGWGLFGQVLEEAKQYNTVSKNAVTAGDPSLTLTHPTLYKGDRLSIGGQLRQYFPATDFAISRNLAQSAYYSFLNYKFPKNYDLGNTFIARYFGQPAYAATDTNFLFEDFTTAAHNINSWLRIGLGQHTQVENHAQSAAGTLTEVYPFADFMLAKTVFVGPRFYFPVYVNGFVYDGPSQVSTSQMQGELYFQATL